MNWRVASIFWLLASCSAPTPAEDFGARITPVKYYNAPGMEVRPGQWAFGWVRVSQSDAEAYKFELGTSVKRQVVDSAKGAPGYRDQEFHTFYREAARRYAAAELRTRGLCDGDVILASELAADAKNRVPFFVVKCAAQ